MAAFAIFVTEYFFTIKSAARPMVAARRTACPQPFKFLARLSKEGRHTIEEVKAEPKRAPAGRPGGQQNRNPDTRAMEDMERMRRLMAQMKADDAAQEGGG